MARQSWGLSAIPLEGQPVALLVAVAAHGHCNPKMAAVDVVDAVATSGCRKPESGCRCTCPYCRIAVAVAAAGGAGIEDAADDVAAGKVAGTGEAAAAADGSTLRCWDSAEDADDLRDSNRSTLSPVAAADCHEPSEEEARQGRNLHRLDGCGNLHRLEGRLNLQHRLDGRQSSPG